MSFVSVYLRLYGDCARKASAGIGHNAWTLLLPMALVVAMTFAGAIVSRLPLGFIGGFLLGFAGIAALSSYLYFVSEIVTTGRVHLAELRQSFVRLFWPVMGVGFVVWIARLLLGFALASNPNAGTLLLLFELLVLLLVFVNPTPEVICQRGMSSGLATLQHSFQFIQENWIEWYLPNVLLGAGVWFLLGALSALGFAGPIAVALAAGAALHWVMVFRGHLYLALAGSTHRQRMFRYRTGPEPPGGARPLWHRSAAAPRGVGSSAMPTLAALKPDRRRGTDEHVSVFGGVRLQHPHAAPREGAVAAVRRLHRGAPRRPRRAESTGSPRASSRRSSTTAARCSAGACSTSAAAPGPPPSPWRTPEPT